VFILCGSGEPAMRCLRSIRGLLAIVALTAGPRLALAQDATRLDADVPIWRDLVAGDAHHYTITLDSGRFAFIAVEQHGIDVIVRVRDPEGTEVAEVDSPNGTQGIEPVLLFTELDGDYRIEVSPLNEDAEPGRYAIGIERVEPVATTVAGRVHQVFAVWDRPGAPGASIGIMQDSESIFATGYGEAQLEYGVPITPETVFHVASVSKQFTAFAVILLADRGLLSLDDDIREYLPEIHDFGPTITIRHLIHHVSGLRDQSGSGSSTSSRAPSTSTATADTPSWQKSSAEWPAHRFRSSCVRRCSSHSAWTAHTSTTTTRWWCPTGRTHTGRRPMAASARSS
jgi:hypothetical protein